jgi:hypothetical protein
VLGAAGGGHLGLGDFVVGGVEADLESFGFAGPAFAFGLGDAGLEVVADLFEAVPLGGVDAEHVVSTAWHHVQQAASATVTFIKHHAATIASVVTSVAVFAGCEATLGTVTGGAATTVCGGLAGAAGSAVGYAVTAVQNHDFSWSGLGDAALTGAVAGAAFAGLGELAGAGLGLLASGAADAVGALADSAAGEVGAEGAADAAGESGGEASESSEGSGSGASGSADDPGQATAAAGSSSSDSDPSSDSCTVGGQSFTAGTMVLLASGKSEAISKLTVGQKVLATSTKTGKNQVETVRRCWSITIRTCMT